jgi:hypothetical protein
MALTRIDPENWHYKMFMDAIQPYPKTDWLRARTKEEVRAYVERDVSKLWSVSSAARKWIISERMKYAGWADDGAFHFKRKHPRMYFMPARQQGKTLAIEHYKIAHELAQ